MLSPASAAPPPAPSPSPRCSTCGSQRSCHRSALTVRAWTRGSGRSGWRPTSASKITRQSYCAHCQTALCEMWRPGRRRRQSLPGARAITRYGCGYFVPLIEGMLESTHGVEAQAMPDVRCVANSACRRSSLPGAPTALMLTSLLALKCAGRSTGWRRCKQSLQQFASACNPRAWGCSCRCAELFFAADCWTRVCCFVGVYDADTFAIARPCRKQVRNLRCAANALRLQIPLLILSVRSAVDAIVRARFPLWAHTNEGCAALEHMDAVRSCNCSCNHAGAILATRCVLLSECHKTRAQHTWCFVDVLDIAKSA